MSNYLNRATAEARKVRDAVGAASEHGQKTAEEALSAFSKAAERARDNLETLLEQAKPYIRQAKPYLDDASAYFDKTRRRISGRNERLHFERPIVLTVASVGAILLVGLLLAPKRPKLDDASDQPAG